MKDIKKRMLFVVNKIIEVVLIAMITAFLTAFIVISYLKPYLENFKSQSPYMFQNTIEKVNI